MGHKTFIRSARGMYLGKAVPSRSGSKYCTFVGLGPELSFPWCTSQSSKFQNQIVSISVCCFSKSDMNTVLEFHSFLRYAGVLWTKTICLHADLRDNPRPGVRIICTTVAYACMGMGHVGGSLLVYWIVKSLWSSVYPEAAPEHTIKVCSSAHIPHPEVSRVTYFVCELWTAGP